MSLISKTSLLKRIRRGRKARAELVESNLSRGIAFQIRAIRDSQEMTQSQLAQAIGMSQNNLSRLENPEYGKHSLSTLKRIAEALDLALVVRFVPFSQYVAWLSGSPFMDRGISSESLAPANFEKEEKTGALEESKKYWERINGRLKNQRLWNVEPIEQASKPPKQEFESSPVWASDWRSHA